MEGIKKQYSLGRKILITMVPAGSGLITVIVNSSFMKFYTDVIGLSPAMFGVVYLLFSIWNGLNDPVIGYWADKKPFLTGRGKYSPLIRWSLPVIGVSVIGLLFASPGWNELIIAGFLLLLLVIYEGAQTLLNVSFQAFTVNTFLSMDERTEVQVIQSYVSQLPVFLGGMIPVWFLTGTYSRSTLVWIFTGTILIGLVMMRIGEKFIRENEEFYRHMEVTRGLKQLFSLSKELFREKVFVIFMLAFFFLQAGTGNYFAGYIYYMDNVLEVSGLKATIPDVLTGVFQMAIFPLIVLAVRKYGSRDTLWRGLLLAAVGHLVLTFPVNYWITSGTYIVILAGYGFSGSIGGPFRGLVVDHIELKTGKRQPGVVAGIMAVLLIPAGSIQPLILSTLLSASGYDGAAKHQTAEVVRAIRIGTGLIPAVLTFISIILIMLIPINRHKEREIQNAIEKKHGQKNQAREGDSAGGALPVPEFAD